MAKASEVQRRRWREEIEAWRQSGESLSAWARRRGESRDTLEYWKRRFAGKDAASDAGTAIRLILVTPDAATVPAGCRPLELVIERAGLRVVLPSDFEAGALSRLLDVVEARC